MKCHCKQEDSKLSPYDMPGADIFNPGWGTIELISGEIYQLILHIDPYTDGCWHAPIGEVEISKTCQSMTSDTPIVTKLPGIADATATRPRVIVTLSRFFFPPPPPSPLSQLIGLAWHLCFGVASSLIGYWVTASQLLLPDINHQLDCDWLTLNIECTSIPNLCLFLMCLQRLAN